MNAKTEKAIKNYERDIKRFRVAAKQWPSDRAKYLNAVENLRTAVNKFKTGEQSL